VLAFKKTTDRTIARAASASSSACVPLLVCGKSQHEVRKLIAGPTVFICDECVELCMDIIGGREQVLVGEVARWFRPPRKAVAAKEDIEPFGGALAVVLEHSRRRVAIRAHGPPVSAAIRRIARRCAIKRAPYLSRRKHQTTGGKHAKFCLPASFP
jgi:hypothetical protein